MERVAVVGGGFAGVYAIKRLQHASGVEITLFEPRDRFVFTPLLHEVAADVLHVPSVTHAYTELFRRNVRHVREKVTAVQLEEKTLTAGGKRYAYDYIIVCTGSRTWFPKEMDVHELKTIEDALGIRRAVERNVTRAAEQHDDALLSCIVVGGGPTGVELAVELQQLYRARLEKEFHGHEPRVTIIQSGDILKDVDERVRGMVERKLAAKGVTVVDGKVTDVTGRKVRTRHGTHEAELVIWTAGVVPDAPEMDVSLLEGHLPRSETLQIPGFPYAFAVGDVASREKFAQAAVQEGEWAAKNLVRVCRGKTPRRFTYRSSGFLMSVGQKDGAGVIMGIPVSGFLAWFIWRTVYLLKFVGVKSKVRLAMEYTVRLFRRPGKGEVQD